MAKKHQPPSLAEQYGALLQKYCPKCDRLLPTSAFATSLANHDGLGGWCRSCENEKVRAYRREHPGRDRAWGRFSRAQYARFGPVIQRAYKECPGCDAIKPVSAFARNRTMADGYQSHCRVCKAAQLRAYRARKRTERERQVAQ